MRLDDENASFRFNQNGLRKFLGDLECEIMELVWEKAKPSVTVRDIYEALRHERQIAYTTVMTTMVRLSEKGMLRVIDKIGLANCYAPEHSRLQFTKLAVERVLTMFAREFPDESAQFFDKLTQAPSSLKKSTRKQR